MVVSSVGIGGCVVGGEYEDPGTMEEIYQVVFIQKITFYDFSETF